MKAIGLEYYFVYDSGDKWYYFDMEKLITKFRSQPELFWKDEDHYSEHLYNYDKRTAYKIPLYLAKEVIDKPTKYIWLSQE